jgi:hypothetical protein
MLERYLQEDLQEDMHWSLAQIGKLGRRVTTGMVKRSMKIFLLMALFSAIAAASHLRNPREQPKPAT